MVSRRVWLWVLGGVGTAGLIGVGALQAQQASAPASSAPAASAPASSAPTSSAPAAGPTLEQMLTAGEQALRQNELGQARSWFSAVLERDPRQPHGLLGMADVLRLSGPQSSLEAVEYYRQFLQVQQRSGRYGELLGRAHFGLGTVYLQAGHYRLAKESLERAYRAAPRDADRAVSLALAHEGLKEFSEAVKRGEEAVQLDPQNPMMFRRLAQFYWGARNMEAAMRTVEAGAELLRSKLRARPDDSASLQALRETQGLKLQMLQVLVQQQEQQDPKDAQLCAQLWLQMSRGVQEQIPVIDALSLLEALGPAEMAAQYAPQDGAVRLNQARLLYLLGRAPEAEQALEAIRAAGRVGEALSLVQAQLQAAPHDPALERIRQFLEQPTTRSATP